MMNGAGLMFFFLEVGSNFYFCINFQYKVKMIMMTEQGKSSEVEEINMKNYSFMQDDRHTSTSNKKNWICILYTPQGGFFY